MESKRALRRHHLGRMKRRAFGIYWTNGLIEDREVAKYQALLAANNLASCSCMACGHRRLYNGVTLQEKKIAISEKEQFEEWAIDRKLST